MTTKTNTFKFNLIDLNKIPWNDLNADNWRLVDSVLAKFVTISNIQGVWDNSLAVTVGQRYVDREAGSIWTVDVAHTTAATGLFSTDRAGTAGRWTLFSSVDATSGGTWAATTAYAQNSYLIDTNRYGVTVNNYTSSTTYDIDVAAGNIVTLIDMTTDLAAAALSATNAAASETAAAASAASLNLPDPPDALNYIRGNAEATAYESRTVTQALGDIVVANSVTLAMMAGITAGGVIAGDASGDPEYVATGNSGEYLTSGGAGAALSWTANSSTLDVTSTTLLFYQETVPTGWTRVTTAAIDKHALVIDTQTALGSFTGTKGGANAFATAFNGTIASGAHAGTAPAHTHQQTMANITTATQEAAITTSSTAGATNTQTGVDGTGNGTTTAVNTQSGGAGGTHTHVMDLQVAYINLFLASKN